MKTITERPRAKRRLADEYPDRVRPSKLAHAVLTTPNPAEGAGLVFECARGEGCLRK